MTYPFCPECGSDWKDCKCSGKRVDDFTRKHLQAGDTMTIRHSGREHEVYLGDNGTLDTLITVDGIEHTFDGEYASQYRDSDGAMTEDGLRTLAIECIEECEEHWN